MMLNSNELLSVITGVKNENCVQQVGIDLELVQVKGLGEIGMILKDKTVLPKYNDIPLTKIDGCSGWLLHPGYYEVRFNQGCKIPDNIVLKIRQRSSLLRSGGSLHSSIFDPGFETESIGSFIQINHPVFIEEGARIAQIYGHFCTPVPENKKYSGQFQGDKQRKA